MSDSVLRPETRTTDNEPQRFWRRLVYGVIAIVLISLLVWFVLETAHVLLLLFLAVLFTVILRTFTDWLHTHVGMNEKIALAAVVLLLVLAVALLLYYIGPQIVEQLAQLIEQLPQSLNAIESYLQQYGWGRELLNEMPDINSVNGVLGSSLGQLFTRITGLISSTLGAVSMFIILFFTAIYLAIEPGIYVHNAVRLFPKQRRERIHGVLTEIYHTLQRWLFTRFVSMILVGALTLPGLLLLGIPFALTLAILAAIGAFIPTFGPILALIPAVMVALLQSPMDAAYVTLLYIGIQAIDNYIVTPYFARNTLYLPPALIVAAQLLLAVLLGQIGLVVAAPLLAMGVVLVKRLYVEDVLHDEVAQETA